MQYVNKNNNKICNNMCNKCIRVICIAHPTQRPEFRFISN